MLLQFFKHANGKFILLILLFVLILRTGLAHFHNLDFVSVGIAYLLHGISAIFINRISTKNLITKKYSFLPAFIFLLLTSSVPFMVYNDVTLAFCLFCLALVGLSNIYSSEHINEKLFNAGLIISFAIFINPILILCIAPLIFIFQIIYNVNQIKNTLVSLTALLTPIVILSSIQYILIGNYSLSDPLFSAFTPTFKPINSNFITLGFPMVLTLVSLSDLRLNYQHKKILSRKFILLIAVLAIMHLLIFFVTPIPITSAIFILLPITIFLANYFEHIKTKWAHHLMFLLMILYSITIPFLLT